jgi:hypothetical protein
MSVPRSGERINVRDVGRHTYVTVAPDGSVAVEPLTVDGASADGPALGEGATVEE